MLLVPDGASPGVIGPLRHPVWVIASACCR